ncbi:MAG: competence/damage-inducible protein A [Candidatus Polarisedimenticolia bacterium]
MSPPAAEFIAIGSELLEPDRTEGNGAFISLRLGEIGVPLRFRTVVGDRMDDLQEALRTALRRSSLIVATGGLGPTVDDVTREAASAVLGRPLVEDAAIVRGLEERFRTYGQPMPPQNRRQAMVLRGAEVLANPRGTAPGQLIREGDRILALLPGVPSEMRAMVDQELLPRLHGTGERLVSRVLRIAGLPESEVDRRLEPVARAAAPAEWTILGSPGLVEIRLRERTAAGAAPLHIPRLEAAIASILGPDLFGRDGETLEEVVGGLLLARGATLAIAESLTGGAIAARVVEVPGASRYFRGGAVCYTDEAKRDLAGVPEATLRAHGAVSEATARAMAEGIRTRMGAHWGVAATGFAGPEGGGPGQPRGTVIVAASGPDAAHAVGRRFPGDRRAVRERAVVSALDLLRRLLLGVVP